MSVVGPSAPTGFGYSRPTAVLQSGNKMISLGAVYNGPELQGASINRCIMLVSKAVKDLRGALGETPWVNAVFVVPGSLGNVDFEGLVYGEYSKKDDAVVVQIPVPSTMAAANESTQISFVIDALHGANAMAFEFFRKKAGAAFPLRDAENLVSSLPSIIN